jgi:cytochrome c
MNARESYPLPLRVMHAAVLLGVLAWSAYQPYRVFGVTPFTVAPDRALVDAGPAPSVDPYAGVGEAPELSDATKQDFMWCRFCHTFESGGAHGVGPNLHRVFGRRAASAPGFYFSPALVEAGQEGLVWTDASVQELIADPERFLEGRHRMRYKPITDPADRAAIIAALKAATK